MILSLDEDQVRHLRFVVNSKPDEKLDVSSTHAQQCTESLVYLFREATKFNFGHEDFSGYVRMLGSNDSATEVLQSYYGKFQASLGHMLRELPSAFPHYADMDWRLDVQCASRCLVNQIEPQIILRLQTKDNISAKFTNLQTDPKNLLKLTQNLEEAIHQLKLPHSRRILRNI